MNNIATQTSKREFVFVTRATKARKHKWCKKKHALIPGFIYYIHVYPQAYSYCMSNSETGKSKSLHNLCPRLLVMGHSLKHHLLFTDRFEKFSVLRFVTKYVITGFR